jgi:integrase
VRPTHQVRFWEIKVLKPDSNGKRRRRPFGVRWVTGGREHSEWFTTKALAKAHLGKLTKAANDGEAFDVVTGLPESLYRDQYAPTLLQVAREFLEDIWPDIAPNSRMRLVDSLAVAVQAFLDEESDAGPYVIRRALTTVALPPDESTVADSDLRELSSWLEKHSRQVTELTDEKERTRLGRQLVRNLNGSRARTSTIETRKGALVQALSFAVRRAYLGSNPFSDVSLSKFQRGVAIDPGVVVNPVQARSLLAAVTYALPRGRNRSWRPFFATLYYAGTRPSEARFLTNQHCVLPTSGWGELVLPHSLGKSTARYSDDGEIYQTRSLKHRADEDTRRVPIPPELVRILSEHLDATCPGPGDRLFSGADGRPLPNASYTDVWRRARPLGLPPSAVNSSLARRPYDLRHAAVSSWIAAGVPIPEVARRAGQTVQVLTTVYAKVIYGAADLMNQRIEAFLRDDVE